MAGSPLLDEYNQTGVVSPGLQEALARARQTMASLGPAPMAGPTAPSPTISAPPEPARSPFLNPAPMPLVGSAPGGPPPPSAAPTLSRSAAPEGPTPLVQHQQNLNRMTAPFQPRYVNRQVEAMGPPAPDSGSDQVMVNHQERNPLAHTSADTGRAGIDQIHSPWLRVPLQVLEAIGRYKMPQLVGALPGTQLHHNLLVDQERQNVAGLEKGASEEAQQKNLVSEANARDNPQPKPPTEQGEGKTITTDQGIMGWNPETKRYDVPMGNPPEKAARAGIPKVIKDSEGYLYRDNGEGEPVPIVVDGKHMQGQLPSEKTPNADDKYRGMLAKIAKGEALTKDEAADKMAFEQWTKMTKTDPGVARMLALAQGRPVQVTGEDGTAHWDLAGHAISTGAQTTSSIPFRAAASTTQSFTSGANATTLNAINTAHAHISQLQEIGDALKNGDIVGVNRIANAFAQQTGQPAPASFQLLKTAVSAELAKTTHGGVATEKETEEISKAINAANSPAQLHGALQAARTLMESKREQLHGQFQQGIQGRPNFGGQPVAGQTVNMKAPDGTVKPVPASQVEHFKSLGAVEVK
jgi:hypothetical protein